jgi:hypothetical protein
MLPGQACTRLGPRTETLARQRLIGGIPPNDERVIDTGAPQYNAALVRRVEPRERLS